MSFGKKNTQFFIPVLLISFFISHFLGVGEVYGAFEYKLLEAIPLVGDSGQSPNLTTLIVGVYRLALWTVGIAALFMLSVGAFYYISSAGNTSSAGTAKKIITDSLLGLFIAVAAWLLLFIINPDLVQNDVANINLFKVGVVGNTGNNASRDSLSQAQATGDFQSTNNYSTGGMTTDQMMANGCFKDASGKYINCVKCNECTKIIGCSENGGECWVSSDLVAKIGGYSVIGAWPPKKEGSVSCILSGTCVKINPGGTDQITVVSAYLDLISKGLEVAYYTSGSCSAYTFEKISGSVITTDASTYTDSNGISYSFDAETTDGTVINQEKIKCYTSSSANPPYLLVK